MKQLLQLWTGLDCRLLWKTGQAFASFGEVTLGLGKAESHEAVAGPARKKRLARYPRDAGTLQQIHRAFLTGRTGQARDICEHIVGSLRNGRRKSRLRQCSTKPIPLLLILLGELAIKRRRPRTTART